MSDLSYYIAQALEARLAEEKARAGYEGGSWGWHGHSYIEAVRKADEALDRNIVNLIDERIRAALAERA